ncbi:MAG: GNAT family N-acetyltransferase [Muribaculaceae bacterium]|nr:GNAT family N-acetyltransferase [Muribaculaceae bacterium]
MMDELKEYEKRKRDMVKLWEKTFHDSKRYIDLVFDAYFTLDNSFVRYDGDRLIAALLGVSYLFNMLEETGDKKTIIGFYLCGLATEPEWRRRGIMSQLMEEAEMAAKERGYEMTFLIPADDQLREYYHKKGYKTSSFMTRTEYKRPFDLSDRSVEKMNIYTIKDFFDKDYFLKDLAEECRKIDERRNPPSIVHSSEDFLTIMSENENSFFLTKPSFDPKYPILANVRAVVFPQPIDNKKDMVRIVGVYDIENLLEYEEHSQTNNLSRDVSKREIIDEIFLKYGYTRIEFLMPCSDVKEENGRVVPYAMIKPLGESVNSALNQNRNFEISLMLD